MGTLHRIIVGIVMTAVWFWTGGAGVCLGAQDHAGDLEKIIAGIEARYAGKGFSADFFQESMLKAMQITDTAEGHLTVKRPGKMRWEYTVPDEQIVITNGSSMWIYRPADHQVMVGKAPELGAGLLSDIRQIRKSFKISLIPSENANYYRLKLVPVKTTPELADIILSVAKGTYQVDQVVTHNAYQDETRIVLSNYRFNIDPDESLFNFTVPEGVDVVELDQP